MLYQELDHRELIHQCTDPELEAKLNQGSMTLYCGFDPTADSLHVGSLVPLLTLKRFQMAGHRVIAVLGGATGMIGDPSFKSQERSLLTNEQLEKNIAGIRKIIEQILAPSGPNQLEPLVVNNADWFRGISYIDFLRDVGKHFTVNHMVAKESVRARLEDREQGISYTEFSYMLLQAYDFYVLNKDHNCQIQIGGSDQWGNITAGGELVRRIYASKGETAPSVYGLTFPLVAKADGTKFGKTESGNIWLDPNRTSPYQFYQFFLRSSDKDVLPWLKYFTFLSIEEIGEIASEFEKNPGGRLAQKRLAEELTCLVHGQAELDRAIQASGALFGKEIQDLDQKTLMQVFGEAPSTQVERSQISSGLSLIDALALTKLSGSKGAARRDISGGGVYVNNERRDDPEFELNESLLIAGRFLVLRKGKKNYHLVEVI